MSGIFQSTPSQRGRPATEIADMMIAGISIHALAKRATMSLWIFRKSRIFQSTPSQRGRPLAVTSVPLPVGISIHALAKRATERQDLRRQLQIHFNPRPRKEGDIKLIDSFGTLDIISIHALAKRATANLYNDYLYFEAKYHISDIFPL